MLLIWHVVAALAAPVQLAVPIHAPAESPFGAVSVQPSLWTSADATDANHRVWQGVTEAVPLTSHHGVLVLGASPQTELDSSVLVADRLWVDLGTGDARMPLSDSPHAAIADEMSWARGVVVQRDGAREWSDGSVGTSCMAYLEPGANYAYLGAVGDGVYRVDPEQDGSSFDVFCDMTTDGGGWALVWSNVGGDLIGTVSNQALLASPNAMLVHPPEQATGSKMHAQALAAWGGQAGHEWLKRTVLWDPNGHVVSNSRLRLDLGASDLLDLFSGVQAFDKQCFPLKDRIMVHVDGVYVGGTTHVFRNFLSAPSYGLPSDAGSDIDCGLDPVHVLDTDRAPLQAGQTQRFRAPDALSYRHDVASDSSSRCYHACWSAAWDGYSEAFVWGVR